MKKFYFLLFFSAVEMSINNKENGIKEAFIGGIKALRLKQMAKHQFLEFRRLRELYKKPNDKKIKQPKDGFFQASCICSISEA